MFSLKQGSYAEKISLSPSSITFVAEGRKLGDHENLSDAQQPLKKIYAIVSKPKPAAEVVVRARVGAILFPTFCVND